MQTRLYTDVLTLSVTEPGKHHPINTTDRHRRGTTLEMDSLKQFTSCVMGKNPSTKRGAKKSQHVRRSSFTRRQSVSRRRSLPCSSGQKVPDSWLRMYQDELKRER